MTTLPMFSVPVDRTDTDERFTPKWVFDALGESFDLDPASPEDATTNVPAARVFTRKDDGLSQPWADRFIEHGDGIWLGVVANARWTQDMLRTADVVWLMRDFPFDHPTHSGKRSSMPLAMFGYGARARAAMIRAARALPDAGVLVERVLFPLTTTA